MQQPRYAVQQPRRGVWITLITMALLASVSFAYSQGTDEAWNKAKSEANAVMVEEEKCSLSIKEYLTSRENLYEGFNVVVGSNSVMISSLVGTHFAARDLKAEATYAAATCIMRKVAYLATVNPNGSAETQMQLLNSSYYHAYLYEYGGQHRTAEAIVTFKDWYGNPTLLNDSLKAANRAKH